MLHIDFVSSNLLNLLNNSNSFSVSSFLFSMYSAMFLWIRIILLSSLLFFIFIGFYCIFVLIRIFSTKLSKSGDSGTSLFLKSVWKHSIFHILFLSRISTIDFCGFFSPMCKIQNNSLKYPLAPYIVWRPATVNSVAS